MNSGNRPYWISTPCAYSGGIDGCGQPARPNRSEVSSSAHHAMLNITATVPARNSGRCGAAASSRGMSASGDEVEGWSDMRSEERRVGKECRAGGSADHYKKNRGR